MIREAQTTGKQQHTQRSEDRTISVRSGLPELRPQYFQKYQQGRVQN